MNFSYRPIHLVFSFNALPFSTTSCLFENSYLVGGQTLTVTQIRQVPAVSRTIQHWLILVDWDLQRQRPYVVVDPYDPQGLLYLSRTEYLFQLKVWASNDLAVMVIARPGSGKPDPVSTDTSSQQESSQNSPPLKDHISSFPEGKTRVNPLLDRSARISWKSFLDLRKYVLRNVSVKSGMVSVSADSIASTVYLWGRELLHYAEVKNPGRRLSIFTSIVKHLQTLLRNNGTKYTIARMKIYLFVLYNFVLGNPLTTTQPLGIRVKLQNGLPSFLDRELRGEIRRGDLQVTRVIASIFNIYRALRAVHGEPDYKTITAPHPDFSSNAVFASFQHFCREVFPTLVKKRYEAEMGKPLSQFEYKTACGLLIRSAGANLSAPSSLSMLLDAQAWAAAPENHILKWFELHKDTSMKILVRDLPAEEHFLDCTFKPDWYEYTGLRPERLDPELLASDQTYDRARIPWVGQHDPDEWGRLAKDFASFVGGTTRIPKGSVLGEGLGQPYMPSLGRLHLIPEAAGKIRIVAICDYWTQAALKPVHEYIFEVLRGLRVNDATFDQQGVTNAYFQRGYKPHWSYDLKAATDTIPIALYKEVLTPFLRSAGETEEIAKERVDLWAKILTDRDWLLPDGRKIRYGTGQPMGALSSWASLALTHHALVQFSKWTAEGGSPTALEGPNKVRPGWFEPYLVLGDDVDLARDKAVADQYVLNCSIFNVIIGIAKSIHSVKNGFEFANQRFCENGNISPLSLKEELSALTWGGRMEFANRILDRFGTKSRNEVAGLVRKVTTAPQWEALQPELTGTRSELWLRFLRYCLLNPFYLSVRNKTELNIDSIISWISLLSQDIKRHPIIESPLETAKLESALIKKISESVKAMWKKRVTDIPLTWEVENPAVTFGKVTFQNPGVPLRDNVLFLKSLSFLSPTGESVWRGKEGRWELLQGTELEEYRGTSRHRLRVPARAPNTYLYLLYCVDEHNKMVKERLDELYDTRIQEAICKLPLSSFTRPKGFSYSALLLEWIEIWVDLNGLPKAIRPNLRNMGKALRPETLSQVGSPTPGRNAKPTSQETIERIYGPMRAVCAFIAEQTGIVVPGLPFFADGRKGKAWLRELRLGFELYLDSLATKVASPIMWPEATDQLPVVYQERDTFGMLRQHPKVSGR